MYASATRARDRIGRFAWWGLVLLLLVIYLASVVSPPPPSVPAIAWTGILGGLVILALAIWADRHRETAQGG
jgi:membrane associated rhomboid family serine protease